MPDPTQRARQTHFPSKALQDLLTPQAENAVLLTEIRMLREELAELRAELVPATSVLMVGMGVMNEYNRITGKS